MIDDRADEDLAAELTKLFAADPHQHEVTYLAEQTGASQQQVTRVLEERVPDGGWLPEDVAEQHREARTESIHIGYRWPDGELRDTIFDQANDEHLARMGLTRVDA